MPDVLASNTLRFCTDTFGYASSDGTVSALALEKKALIQAKKGRGWNCKKIDSCTGFEFYGSLTSQPEGTKICFVFKVFDHSNSEYSYKKLNTSGGLVTFGDVTATSGSVLTDVDDVLANGNTLTQLKALTNIPGFVGKSIWPVIALSGRADLEAPTVKLGLKTINGSVQKTDEYESDTIQLVDSRYSEGDDLPCISKIEESVKTTGAGSCTSQVRLQNADNTWTSYMSLNAAADKEAKAVQFKANLSVETVDSDSVKLNHYLIEHSQGGKVVVTDGTARLYSTVFNYEVPLQSCCVTVRHNQLKDSKIEAFVNFMPKPQKRELLQLGAGKSSIFSYTLGEGGVGDEGIDGSTIELYYGDTTKEQLVKLDDDDFSYNLDSESDSKTVDANIPKTKLLYASYEYGHGKEVWRKMTADTPQPFVPANGTYTTRFFYTLPNSEAENKTVSNILLRLTRNKGTVAEVDLGAAPSSKTRIYPLEHIAVDGTIKFTNDSVSSYLDTDTNILSVTAPTGTERKFSYDWKGEEIVIPSFTAAWSLA